MSSLREAIERRRAAEGRVNTPNPFFGTKDRVFSLYIDDSADEVWILPWNHFICARLESLARGETLVLTFVAHEVEVLGVRLGELLPEIANQRLEWMRAVPGKYLKTATDEPAIESVHVRSLRNPIVSE